MRLNQDEIAASPKLIFSVDMNVQLHREDVLDLLKRDILVEEINDLDHHYDRIRKIADPYTALVFNLDLVIRDIRANPKALKHLAAELIRRLNALSPGKTLVITSYINPEVAYMFRSEGIAYVEKIVLDQRDLQNIILNLVPPFFTEKNRLVRNFLRINVLARDIAVEIQNTYDGKGWGPLLTGRIKDISLNGMNVVFEDADSVACFAERDNVFLKFSLNEHPIRIFRAIVSRLLPDQKELCLYYDLLNPSMVNDLNATFLSNFVYGYLHKIVEFRTKNL